MLIVENGTVITRDSNLPLIHNGAVAISGDVITDVGTTAEMRSKYGSAERIDVDGKVIMPGLINAHHHIYSSLARGMTAPPSRDFTAILENLWWRLDKALTLEDVKYSAYTTLIGCISAGVTTVFDHHASLGAIEGSLEVIRQVASELGIRISLCFEVSDRLGADVADRSIRENADFIRSPKKAGMESALFGLHASFTLSDSTLDKCVAESGGAGFHVHTAEGKCDNEFCRAQHGQSVVERLNAHGILNEKSLAIHCIHVNKSDMDTLLQSGVTVVHNPQSNMGNAVGASPIVEMHKLGIPLGMGTDGYTNDVLESLKTANLLQKHQLGDPSVCWTEPPEMLIDGNRKIVKRQFDIDTGILRKGAKADVIVLDYKPFTELNENNINSHMHFGMYGACTETVIIDGRVIMRDRLIAGVDKDEIFAKSRETASKLWKRI